MGVSISLLRRGEETGSRIRELRDAQAQGGYKLMRSLKPSTSSCGATTALLAQFEFPQAPSTYLLTLLLTS